MSLLRLSSSSLLRQSARAPTMSAARFYSDGPNNSSGATATSKGFQKREEAQEGQYIREQEKEKLAKLRESLAAQRKHLDEVDKALNDFDKKK